MLRREIAADLCKPHLLQVAFTWAENPEMTWPFQRGRIYDRRRDIHDAYEGQRQGGIITPKRAKMVILITGKKGRNHGYVDTWNPDGTFEYVGEGQYGDMAMTKGNLAIATHYERGKDLLLFTKLGKGALRFEGEWICTGHRVERRPDTDREMREAFVFEMCRAENMEARTEEVDDNEPGDADLKALRARAIAAAAPRGAAKLSTRQTHQRSREVRRYVLARAKGKCEGCESAAPFLRPNGSGYLEAHHTHRRSDGGPDHPDHVIAICPTCHRRVHHGMDGETYNEALKVKMLAIALRAAAD